ncbi:MAG: NADH-quinone oxidoreductase subunit N [Actinobacteria bacterium]|nr:NADH-quinone oxidoreductase subunit N [Actinomycetota bacterium]
MPIGDLAPQITLLVGAAAAVIVSLFTGHHRQWLAAPLALAALTVAAAAQLAVRRDSDVLTFDGQWALDGLTTWGAVIIVVTTALTVGLSPRWMRTDRRHGEYYAMLLLAALGAQVMAGAADVMELVVGILLSSVTGYVLASYHRRSPLSAEAGVKFFLIGGLTNSLLLVGAVLLFTLSGTTLYRDIAAPVATPDASLLVIAVALIVIGIAFELGAVPAHAWVPDVSQGAPAPAAAFLTVAPKIGALIALARLVQVLPSDGVGWRPLVAVVAAATMTLGNLAAFWQDDVRRLLGWSSVSQSGYGIMAAVAVGASPHATPALLTFALAYALANLAAFGVVVALRGRTDISDYTGLARSCPWLTAALTLAMLSLVGIPPLIGFTAKLQLFTATIDAGYGWLAVLAVVNTVASLFYYLRVIGPAYLGERGERPVTLGPWSAATVAAATIGLVATGVLAGPTVGAFTGG